MAEKLTEKVMVRLDELKTFLDRWMGRGKSRLRIAYRNQQNVKYFLGPRPVEGGVRPPVPFRHQNSEPRRTEHDERHLLQRSHSFTARKRAVCKTYSGNN